MRADDILKDLLNERFIQDSPFADDLTTILKRLQEKSFRLAIVGEFSSGKSTFLNALIKQDLLKHGATETTATITEIQNINSGDKRFDAYFIDGKIEKDIPIEKLEDYTSTSSKSYSVASEISKVVIKTKVIDSEDDVVFIDTPGLNGIADNHREKTLEQIKNAHACIYLIQVRGLGESDIEFIKFISNYQKNIIFVQNFIDELKILENETVEGKIDAQKKILEKHIFNEKNDVSYSILGISGRKALLSTFESYDGEILSDEHRKLLYKESRFEDIYSEIKSLMIRNHRESTLKKSSILIAKNILGQIIDILSYRSNLEKEEIEQSSESRKARGYESLKKVLESNRSNYENNISNFVISESVKIRRLGEKNIEAKIEVLLETLEQQFNSKRTVNDMDNFLKGNEISYAINNGIVSIENSNNEILNAGFENILCDAIIRVKEYTGIKAEQTEKIRFDASVSVKQSDFNPFTKEENDISRLDYEYRMAKQKEENAELQKSQIKNELNKKKNSLEKLESDKSNASYNKSLQLYNLGNEPAPETKYRTEVTYKSHSSGRGFWGGLWGKVQDFFAGEKRIEQTVEYKDYSKRDAWQKAKYDIENTYNQEINKINKQEKVLRNKLSELESDLVSADNASSSNESENIKRILEAKKEFLEEAKKKAMQEYLRNLKKEVLENLNGYFFDDGNVRDKMIENFDVACEINQNYTRKNALDYFTLAFNQRLQILSDLISDVDLLKKTSENEKLIEKINLANKKLEKCLCQL